MSSVRYGGYSSAAVIMMPYKGDRRSIVIVATALFLLGFFYGVYRSFVAMEGTRILDRARHDMSAPQSTPLDEQSRAVNGADAPGNSTDLQGAVQGYGAAPLSEAPKGSFEDVYYLGVHNNRVAVFVGPPEDGRVLRVIERRLDTLPPREVTLLQQGIRVEGESEMLKGLEGYMQ